MFCSLMISTFLPLGHMLVFADDTIIVFTSSNNTQMQNDPNIVSGQLNKWFKSKLLFLSFDKTYFNQFKNKSKCTSVIQIQYEDKQISIANETKFFGLFINNNVSWKTHIEYIRSKPSLA